MKYIALLLVVLLMGWTWQMAQAEREFGLPESREMEAELEVKIREHLAEVSPDLKSVVFRQLFTEVVEPGREMNIRARYSFEQAPQGGDTTTQVVDAVFKATTQDGTNWVLEPTTTKSALEFKNGMKIEAQDPLPADAAPEAPKADAPKAEEAHGTTNH